jgi:hypothetical protein
MKTKNLFAIGFLMISLCLMNQFSSAQTAPASTKPQVQPQPQPTATVVGCNCAKVGYGCFATAIYCKMACAFKCRNVVITEPSPNLNDHATPISVEQNTLPLNTNFTAATDQKNYAAPLVEFTLVTND